MSQFQNMYNVEIRPDLLGNDWICCCDGFPCNYNLEEFSFDTCDPECDTYFFLTFLECQDSEPCPVMMITDTSANSATTTYVNYDFYYNLSSFATDSV